MCAHEAELYYCWLTAVFKILFFEGYAKKCNFFFTFNFNDTNEGKAWLSEIKRYWGRMKIIIMNSKTIFKVRIQSEKLITKLSMH